MLHNNAVLTLDIITFEGETMQEADIACTVHMDHGCVAGCSCSILSHACVVPTVRCHDRRDRQDARPVTNFCRRDPHMRRQLLPMEIPSNLQGLVPLGYMAVQLHTVSCVDIFFNIKWDDVG